MTTGVAIIEAFVQAFNRKDVDLIMTFFTDDAVYHNMPGPPVTGAPAVKPAIVVRIASLPSTGSTGMLW